ncbi:hypothetical protein PUN28_016838 [Cardiocondyla obscurior]|uniref:Uncharacterized protein n=1 Tax=Cardiocondyla obscurior TaxID=286306 RepID=A0AAW2EST0_9HYME
MYASYSCSCTDICFLAQHGTPATSFPWCPRWCKPGTCPPEAMERIYPPPSPIGNDILFPLRPPSLFPRRCTKPGITSDHSFLRMKSYRNLCPINISNGTFMS